MKTSAADSFRRAYRESETSRPRQRDDCNGQFPPRPLSWRMAPARGTSSEYREARMALIWSKKTAAERSYYGVGGSASAGVATESISSGEVEDAGEAARHSSRSYAKSVEVSDVRGANER